MGLLSNSKTLIPHCITKLYFDNGFWQLVVAPCLLVVLKERLERTIAVLLSSIKAARHSVRQNSYTEKIKEESI